jgi:hypothetical protein
MRRKNGQTHGGSHRPALDLGGQGGSSSTSCAVALGEFLQKLAREIRTMDYMKHLKDIIGSLTEITLMLVALAIALALLAGANVPFFQNTTQNIVAFVDSLSKAGLVGLLALGFILWLFSHRKIT